MTAHFVNLLDDLRRRSLRMAGLVEDIVQEACEAVFSADEELARRVIRRDEEVDQEEVRVETEVIRLLALYQPVGSDLRLLCTVLKVNNDLERIADCAVNVAERSKHLEVQTLAARCDHLRRLIPEVQAQLRRAVQCYGSQDADLARRAVFNDDAVDAVHGEIIRWGVAQLGKSPDAPAGYLDVLSVAKNLERIADHATNIAEDVIYLSTGRIVRHGNVSARD
jgi:phosphate transport system protein